MRIDAHARVSYELSMDGQRLRKARLDRGVTVVELAKILHIGHPMVSMIENDEAEPGAELSGRILTWIRSGSGPRTKPKRGPYRKRSTILT